MHYLSFDADQDYINGTLQEVGVVKLLPKLILPLQEGKRKG